MGEINEAIDSSEPFVSEYQPIELADFLTRIFPPREHILTPIIPERGLVMLYASRGIGKTHLALHMAYAAACGGSCLGWEAKKTRRVVYIDGEMPAMVLQERLLKIAHSFPNKPPEGYFRIIAADMLPNGIPDLSDPKNWDVLWAHIKDAELIVLDNLSTLCRYGRERA